MSHLPPQPERPPMRVQPPKLRTATLLLGLGLLAACGGKQTEVVAVPADEVECMARAMYFESNRSSRDGMVAVGTVVLNRAQTRASPGRMCHAEPPVDAGRRPQADLWRSAGSTAGGPTNRLAGRCPEPVPFIFVGGMGPPVNVGHAGGRDGPAGTC